jgi:hypothetical protein
VIRLDWLLMTNSKANKMTETEYSNYQAGLRLARLIPMAQTSLDALDALRDRQPETVEIQEMFDNQLDALWDLKDQIKGLGWVLSPEGWAYPPRERLLAASW